MPTDRNKPATKADILRLEQKIDQNVARLDQSIAHLDKKLDQNVARLDQKVDRVTVAVVNLQSEVKEMKQTVSTKDDINQVLSAIDAFAKKSEHYDRASVLHGHALVEIEVKVKDHDRRLKILESASR